MKTLGKILLALVVLVGVVVLLVDLLTSSDRTTARDFVLLASTGEYVAARQLLHDELQTQFPLDRFEQVFADVKPYSDVSFSSVETSGSGTSMTGVATTDDDCSSKVSFEVLRDRIIAFNIAPLCRR
ncbi:hypothetical protein [Falsiruegeria mediterranea]|uniref:Uncharacterized protein n=1 Tax=Falsiruegeria mediterranea M17 TaxID=1200281 RepID=A0A2R8CGE5_9RHOB|nr:hypothetical protein [Falsiruegeria mediterranea]SPJ31515.1 hypothetical protein TRM7615_05058 [Falsiruegeria mediterranea M17]